jgi:hypothetical protein
MLENDGVKMMESQRGGGMLHPMVLHNNLMEGSKTTPLDSESKRFLNEVPGDARTTCARRSRGGKALGSVPRAGPCELRTSRRNDTPGSPARSFGAVELHRALYGVFESVCLKIRHISSKLPRRRHIRTTAVNCISRDGADPWDVVAPLALYLRCNFVVSSFGS